MNIIADRYEVAGELGGGGAGIVFKQAASTIEHLYSLGALAYWMLRARHAYPATGILGLRQLWANKAPPSPGTSMAEVPPELDRLVMALLCHDPQGRPASAGEVMDRLSAIADLPPAEDLRVAEAYLARPALVGRQAELTRRCSAPSCSRSLRFWRNKRPSCSA